MGSECSEEEREFRYQILYEGIHAVDKDIKEEMKNTDISKKKYYPYRILNKDLCTKYPFLIDKNFEPKVARKKVFNYKDLINKSEERNFFYINKYFGFCFPENFIFINEDFLDVIFQFVNDEIKKHLRSKFEFIVGGECLIKRNIINSNSNFFRYITLYNELEEKEGNFTDFFLYIKDEKKREEAVNDILKNNIWNYFKKINYNYEDEYKKIVDEKGQEIGYIVRAIELSHIKAYLSRKNQKEKNEKVISNNPSINVKSQKNFILEPKTCVKINKQNLISNNNNININNSVNNNMNNNFNNNLNNGIIANNIQNQINNNMNMNNQNMPFNMNMNNINNINNMNNNFQNMNMQMPINMINNMNMNLNNMNLNNMNNNINNIQNWNNMNNNNNAQVLYDKINYLTNENFNLKNTIQLKDNEIKELKQRIDNLVNNTTQLVDFNKIRVVQFISMDHTIICGIKCLLTDTFAEVEEKLYKIYPQYRETNNVFQIDGRNILRFKTIAENNIQEGHGVQIIKIE